jgi:hypothetical protein
MFVSNKIEMAGELNLTCKSGTTKPSNWKRLLGRPAC